LGCEKEEGPFRFVKKGGGKDHCRALQKKFAVKWGMRKGREKPTPGVSGFGKQIEGTVAGGGERYLTGRPDEGRASHP